MATITPDIHDFVHGFTKRCNELGVHDDAQIKYLLSKAAADALVKAKQGADYFQGTGQPAAIPGEGKKGAAGGEVHGVNQFTNLGTSENYQRG